VGLLMRGKKDWIGHAVDKPNKLRPSGGKKPFPGKKGKAENRSKPAMPFKGFK
jgi:hypothetical protein